jgi:hypothetical protein
MFLWLMLQFLLVCALELADDLIRGDVAPPNAALAQAHARALATFEIHHGLLVELVIQRTALALQGSRALGWIVPTAGTLYVVCHLLCFAMLLVWVHTAHRRWFPLIRNIALLTGALAVAIYEIYPLAPPRLAGPVVSPGKRFHIADTLHALIGGGSLHGTALGYNQYSAMPSLHVAWALIVGVTVAALASHRIVRVAGGLYPLFMSLAVIVTGGHWVLDILGAAVTVMVASLGVVGGRVVWHDLVQMQVERKPAALPALEAPAAQRVERYVRPASVRIERLDSP